MVWSIFTSRHELDIIFSVVGLIAYSVTTVFFLCLSIAFLRLAKKQDHEKEIMGMSSKFFFYSAITKIGGIVEHIYDPSRIFHWSGLTFRLVGTIASAYIAIRLTLKVPSLLEAGRRRKEIEIRERETLERLRKSEAGFKSFCEAPYLCWIRSKKNGFIYVNEAFEKAFGISLLKIKGKGYDAIFETSKAFELQSHDARIFRTQKTTESVESLTTRQGDRDWQIYRFIVDASEGEADQRIGVVAFDISAQTELSRELERSNTELEQFSYSVSHDLQQPLRSISSFTEYLRRELEVNDWLSQDSLDYIKRITRASSRMKTLIDDLLIYSRVGRVGDLHQKVNLNNVLVAVKENIEAPITDSGATIEHGLLPTVVGDDSQLLQLFQNLISNGLKYMPKGKTPKIQIKSFEKGDRYVFGISDNGIGIEAGQLESIFQAFKRLHTSDQYEGNGMGLAICKKIIDHHGGEIWARSEPNKGSIFWFTLPRGVTQ